jgi:hypothetical protein
MSRLLALLQHCRQSGRLIQSVALAFVLSLGVAIASPLVNPQNTQLICSASGGMKVITFADDGTTTEKTSTHGLDCPLCAVSMGMPPASQLECGLQAFMPAKPITTRLVAHSTFQSRAPPARGPPAI